MPVYVPPIDTLEALLGVKLDREDDTQVRVQKNVLRALVMAALHAVDFDQETYLQNNPDLRGAWERGDIPDLRSHFIGSGYFERRKAAPPRVDETWYLEQNRDVGAAINEGRIESAQSHYDERGATEWRAPNPDLAHSFHIWRELYAAR